MDIILINPCQHTVEKVFQPLLGYSHPLSLAYLAGYLQKYGIRVKILDNNAIRLGEKEFKQFIEQHDPLCVGFSLFSYSFENARILAASVKRVNPKIRVIAGGPHATVFPLEILQDDNFDFNVLGEGEETLKELVMALKLGQKTDKIKGITYKQGKEIYQTPEREPIENIDDIPFPAYELLPMEKYRFSTWRSFTDKPVGSIFSGRGCPYDCAFCYSNFGRKLRLRSAENVLEEIKLLKGIYHIGEFMFIDDVFTFNKEHAVKICGLLRKNKINLPWSCNSRVDRADPDLFRELALAGCKGIFFGAESGSQEILDQVNKRVSLDQIEESIKLCRKYKIMSFCNFIIGLPGETESSLQETLNFVKKLNPDFVNFSMFIPSPGSKLFNELIRYEKGSINWNRYFEESFSLWKNREKYLQRDVLLSWQKKAFRKFYCCPKKIVSILSMACKQGNLARIFKSMVIFFKHQFVRY